MLHQFIFTERHISRYLLVLTILCVSSFRGPQVQIGTLHEGNSSKCRGGACSGAEVLAVPTDTHPLLHLVSSAPTPRIRLYAFLENLGSSV